ncbi:MAG: hypothetical protein H8D67_17390 [Deltaproteobacteria bacterium]|nr:hypothetical protein [Deltaproteobacteria bacterium]
MKLDFKGLLGRMFAPLVVPIIRPIARTVTEALLRSFLKTEPSHAKVLLVSGYPIIDVELETLVEKTDTPIDDELVAGVKDAFEVVADEAGVELENLDND